MALDFEGIRVLDFSQVIAGPLAAQHLSLLGADVIKVEPPAGDQMRDRMLPSRWSGIGMAPGFLAMNIGKRSLCLDMKHPEGRALVRELIRSADVLIHNEPADRVRPGTELPPRDGPDGPVSEG